VAREPAGGVFVEPPPTSLPARAFDVKLWEKMNGRKWEAEHEPRQRLRGPSDGRVGETSYWRALVAQTQAPRLTVADLAGHKGGLTIGGPFVSFPSMPSGGR
jgi:hypothetical protein